MKNNIIIISFVIILVVIGLIVFYKHKKDKKHEKYVLMRDIGEFPLNLNAPMPKVISDSAESIKYTGHRYDRHKIRSNPHVRRYQDNLSEY